MRFIHQHAEEICEYVESRGLYVTECSYSGSSPPIVTTPSAIEETLTQSGILWGLALPYYLSVSASVEKEGLPLDRAVSLIESGGVQQRFLIVA